MDAVGSKQRWGRGGSCGRKWGRLRSAYLEVVIRVSGFVFPGVAGRRSPLEGNRRVWKTIRNCYDRVPRVWRFVRWHSAVTQIGKTGRAQCQTEMHDRGEDIVIRREERR